jgi:hypothetical protein
MLCQELSNDRRLSHDLLQNFERGSVTKQSGYLYVQDRQFARVRSYDVELIPDKQVKRKKTEKGLKGVIIE